MNHKQQNPSRLNTFSFQLAVLALLFSTVQSPAHGWNADEPAVKQQPAAKSAAPAPAGDLPAADQILSELRDRLQNLESLQCDLHQTALINGVSIISAGRYTQAAENRVRLQLMLFPAAPFTVQSKQDMQLDTNPIAPAADTARGSLLQVSDGTVLHTEWKNGESVVVTRRTIADILEAAEDIENYDASAVLADLGVGGLRSLIARLQDTMTFAPVKELTVNDRRILQVTGSWNDRVRKEIFQLPENTFVHELPWIPEYVQVFVDAETNLPRRIQFLKHSTDATQKIARPLLTLDLRKIEINGQIDDQLFAYRAPEGAAEEDQTEALIRSIKGEPLPQAPQQSPQ